MSYLYSNCCSTAIQYNETKISILAFVQQLLLHHLSGSDTVKEGSYTLKQRTIDHKRYTILIFNHCDLARGMSGPRLYEKPLTGGTHVSLLSVVPTRTEPIGHPQKVVW
ncbi:hypothetical protein RIF29_29197 [Crotalaria pallida]|uniref:Uncharacterized protein n=1 Tax=Crotalaria pallida TaxID=3830 RepID=A0AAN9EEJ2_CROPI